HKKTPAEKADAKAKRKARRDDYAAALQEAFEVVNQEAIKLHERFGGHMLEYYKEEVLQIGCLTGEKRAVSRWNAYLRHKAKKLNE
ncbi:hypothetical protein C0992_002299, partial [Termitomyces sp. T32_za158]